MCRHKMPCHLHSVILVCKTVDALGGSGRQLGWMLFEQLLEAVSSTTSVLAGEAKCCLIVRCVKATALLACSRQDGCVTCKVRGLQHSCGVAIYLSTYL